MRAPSAIYKSDTADGAPERRACTEGTRVDVLGRIIDWASDASSPPIFWLSGLGGTGKSTIAYTVCRHFDNEGLLVRLCASFFCSRQVAELRRLQNIIPTLAYQLARVSCSFAQRLSDADPLSVHISSEQVEKLLVDPWQQTVHTRPVELPLSLIVIDALDEIDDDGGEKLLRELIKAIRSATDMHGLKILVTSRPHPKIVAATSSLSSNEIYRLEDIEEGWADIRKYLSEELQGLEASCKQGLDDLATLSEGLFIFAATAARLISPREHAHSAKQKAKWLSTILEGRYTLPSSGECIRRIDTLYAEIVGKAIPKADYSLYRCILHNIMCALQPLPVSVHAELVATCSEEKDEEAIELFVSALHAVLYIRDGCVYTYHKSFPDFILDAQRCGGQLACIPADQHAFLSFGCFRIMQASLRFNMCNLPSSFLFDSEVENLKHLIDENIRINAGLEYACQYWTQHLIEVPPISDNAQSLRAVLLEFSEEKIIFWVEAMNLLLAKEACYDGVTAVMAWIDSVVSCHSFMTP
jgi:hypothetical protein